MKLTNERRALVAFALSMIMFVAYDALYLAPRMKAQRARREEAARQEALLHLKSTTGADSIVVQNTTDPSVWPLGKDGDETSSRCAITSGRARA